MILIGKLCTHIDSGADERVTKLAGTSEMLSKFVRRDFLQWRNGKVVFYETKSNRQVVFSIQMIKALHGVIMTKEGKIRMGHSQRSFSGMMRISGMVIKIRIREITRQDANY